MAVVGVVSKVTSAPYELKRRSKRRRSCSGVSIGHVGHAMGNVCGGVCVSSSRVCA